MGLVNSLIRHICNDTNDDFDHDESSIVLKKRPLLQPRKPEQPKSPTPLIIRFFFPTYLQLYLIDGIKEKECRLHAADSLKTASFVATCNGHVLLSFITDNCTRYGVFNPLKNDKITTIDGPGLRKSQACGFFFHPLEKEYRILAVLASTETGYKDEYQICSLGDKNWRKIETPNFPIRPICDEANTAPAVSHGALHWYPRPNVIMVFDMISEELSIKHLPLVDYLIQQCYGIGYLVTKGEELCLCVMGFMKMEVWVLQDCDEWRWAKKYIVDLQWDLEAYPLLEPCLTAFFLVRVVGFDGDRMVLFWRHRGLFLYDLNSRTVERIWMKKLKTPRERGQSYYDRYCGFALMQN